MAKPADPRNTPEREAVLAKAVLRAAEQLGLNQAELAVVLGMNRSAVSRLNNTPRLDPDSKKGELALMVVRCFRALFALMGGNSDHIRHWMRSPNTGTGGTPSEQIQTIQGLYRVQTYLDAMRGKV